MDRALGLGPPFRIDPPVTTTGALGSPVIEVAFHSGRLGLPDIGFDTWAVVTVDLDGSARVSDSVARRTAARLASGVARRAASAIAAREARASVDRPAAAGEPCRVQFAYDEMSQGLARRVVALFELPLEDRESDDAMVRRASPPVSALLVRMADAVHDAVDDPAWAPIFYDG